MSSTHLPAATPQITLITKRGADATLSLRTDGSQCVMAEVTRRWAPRDRKVANSSTPNAVEKRRSTIPHEVSP
jgi:hypothetical protein